MPPALSSPPALRPASLWRRLAALLYDSLLLLGVLFLATALLLPLTGGAAIPAYQPLFQVYLLCVSFGFFTYFWRRGGQTLGMQAWHIRLVNQAGGAISLRQALLRFSIAWLSAAALGLGFVWALFEPQRRTWHDLAAGTRVIRLS